MKLKTFLAAAFLALLGSATAQAQQPYTGCWHPDDIRSWTPETDPDAKFNRSRVAWAPRFKEPTLMKANSAQYYEGQICNATILFPTCSMSPAQGANNFVGYQPNFWQYMDKLVYWAGSASEGIICPPPAGSIDAAHLNGVKVLGQVFFPPREFGGDQTWVRQMLTKENGKYIYAIKLYEIAKYLGFEGWFINEETGGGSTQEWVDFMKDFYAAAAADGRTEMELQWYNANFYPNTTILSTNRQTSQFLEYGNVTDNRNYASSITYPDGTQCTTDEIFSKIYSGVQCVTYGLTGINNHLSNAFKTTGHVASLDLFCPEEHIWKENVSSLLNSSNNVGTPAYNAQAKCFQNEMKMWVNEAGDPSTGGTNSWRGLSGCILERSVITSMPFCSDMANGLGKHRFVEGEKRGTHDWYHSGMQSILPTWRWWIENKGSLSVVQDWDDAYNVGSSYKISGTLSAGSHLMRLYKTMIPITAGGTFRVVYKATGGDVVPVLATESSVTSGQVTLSNPTKTTKNGWTIADYDLSSLNGKTVYMIALNLKSTSTLTNYSMSLGQIAMLPANYHPTAPVITNLQSDQSLGEEKGNIRLTWDFTPNADFDHFDIYGVTSSGRTLMGQTRGEGFYIPTFARNGNDQSIDVQLVPIMKGGTQGTASTVTVNYPEAAVPSVVFSLSKSYAQVGEEISITANGTGSPTAWQWTLPQGLQLVSGQGTKTIRVRCLAQGTQSVTVACTNAVGTSTTTKEVVDVFDRDGISDVTNVVLHKTVASYSGSTNATEVPDRIIDGVTNPTSVSQKWCNINSTHEVVFDLEGSYRIYGFKIYDCKSGPEQNENIPNYRIYLSEDGTNWTLYVDEEGRDKDNIKEDYIAPASARYVKLNPWSESGFTLRIWEFEVYGLDQMNTTMSSPAEVTLNAGETRSIDVFYNLNGDARNATFRLEATSSNNQLVRVGAAKEVVASSKFTLPLTASELIGQAEITVKLYNGTKYRQQTIKVTVDNNELPNVLQGRTATLRHYKTDYGFSAAYDEYTTDALTDGNTTDEACEIIETPSRNTDDFWTIFTADDKWNLAKVKVYFVDQNRGVNDNDRAGFTNKEVSIRISDDGKTWQTLTTYRDLEAIGSLTYLLPETKSTKYLAIVCNLNTYFYPSLAEVEAYEQNADAEVDLLNDVSGTCTCNYHGSGHGQVGKRCTDRDETTFHRFYAYDYSNTSYSSYEGCITYPLSSYYTLTYGSVTGDVGVSSVDISLDGTEWDTNVAAVNGKSFTFPEGTVARYVRFHFVDGKDYVNIYEIYLFGKPYAGTIKEKVYKPAVVSGFNADVLAEASPVTSHTTMALDGESNGYVYYTTSYSNVGGLPADGKIDGNVGYYFQLADYAGNNALALPTNGATGSLTFVTSDTAAGLYLLVTSGNGLSTANAVVTFSDATTETFQLSFPDWYSSTGFYTGLGRANRNTNTIGATSGFKMDALRMSFSTHKQPVRIDFTRTNTGTGTPFIFAVTYIDAQSATGIQLTADGAPLTPVAIYSIDGKLQPRLQRGVNILRFSDGSTQKVIF